MTTETKGKKAPSPPPAGWEKRKTRISFKVPEHPGAQLITHSPLPGELNYL